MMKLPTMAAQFNGNISKDKDVNFEQTSQESDELLLWAALSCAACSSSEGINHKSSLTIKN
jgi:hypothetical protein